MTQRIISGLIGVALLLAVLLSKHLLGIALVIVVVLALFEIYKPFGFIKRFPLAIIGFSLGIALNVGNVQNGAFLMFTVCIYIIAMFILAVCYHKTIKFSDIAILLFTTLYISLMLAHIRLIRDMEYGNFLLYPVFIGAFVSDTGAYFTGSFFGKHKLLPEISPHKTVEGAIGGIVACVLGFVIYGLVLTWGFHLTVNWVSIFVIGTASSLAAQMGDLSASMIKRELNIKDYGSIMPGHGGILDRFDSVIFVTPVVYYLMYVLPIIV